MNSSRPNSSSLFLAWIAAFSLCLVTQAALHDFTRLNLAMLERAAIQAFVPLVFCFLLLNFLPRIQASRYFLFFSISFTSLLGLTQTLTGSHAESGNPILFGLSFYTASLAFLFCQSEVRANTALAVSNPLLIFTGPIATQFRVTRKRSVAARIKYYFPFVILGVFLHQALATPMTQTFFLLDKTDVISSLLFGIIFELFVYANFCGLSLLVFGLCGIIGVRVPLNFRQPFAATNLIDFWKGWHTSLSTVLRALFYAPTRSRFGANIAIASVFFASAIWHGVSLNFLIWGALHAALFMCTRGLLQRGARFLPFMLFPLGVVVGRMIFADSDSARLIEKLTFTFEGLNGIREILEAPQPAKRAVALMAIFVAAEFLFRNTAPFKKRNYKFYRIPVVQLVLLIFTLTTISNVNGIDYAVYGQR